MSHLYVVAEGPTEFNFVTHILRPHLEARGTWQFTVSAPRLDGGYTYAKLKRDVRRLLGSPSSPVMVTTMIDLFAIARDFPGLGDPENNAPPIDRVRHLEGRCSEDIGDGRFIPYLQLHEFEALLLSNIELLAMQYPNRHRALQRLARQLGPFPTPEHVNTRNPPSYRIRQVVPEYNKTVAGVATVAEIGLHVLRERCPHFGQWLGRLETLGSVTIS